MADELAGLVQRARDEAAQAVYRAAVDAGRMVAGYETTYDEAADALEELARPIGPQAVAALLRGLDEGMGGVTEGPPETTMTPTRPSAPAAPLQIAGAALRGHGVVSAAVTRFVADRLVLDPDARIASADLAAEWMAWDGPPVTSVTAALMAWARSAGADVRRYRTSDERGVAGVRLAVTFADSQVSSSAPQIADQSVTLAGQQVSPPPAPWAAWPGDEQRSTADTGMELWR